MEIQDLIQGYKEQILDDMGFENLSEEQRAEMMKLIEERMSIAVIKAISSSISEEEATRLVSKLDSGGEIEADLEEVFNKYPELNDKVQTELGDLYLKLLEESKESWGNIVEE